MLLDRSYVSWPHLREFQSSNVAFLRHVVLCRCVQACAPSILQASSPEEAEAEEKSDGVLPELLPNREGAELAAEDAPPDERPAATIQHHTHFQQAQPQTNKQRSSAVYPLRYCCTNHSTEKSHIMHSITLAAPHQPLLAQGAA